MPILLTIVSGVFGLGTVLLLQPQSWLWTFLCVPFAGSFASAIFALGVLILRRRNAGIDERHPGAQRSSFQVRA